MIWWCFLHMWFIQSTLCRKRKKKSLSWEWTHSKSINISFLLFHFSHIEHKNHIFDSEWYSMNMNMRWKFSNVLQDIVWTCSRILKRADAALRVGSISGKIHLPANTNFSAMDFGDFGKRKDWRRRWNKCKAET